MHINNIQFSLNNYGDVTADAGHLKHFLNEGFATRIVRHHGNFDLVSYRLNQRGVKCASLGKTRLTDIPNTEFWQGAREVIKRIAKQEASA